ncbi:MAG: NifB/NifX family molybdenum-iron cluster-binding protein [Candidatus Hodarchaeota archaeon]
MRIAISAEGETPDSLVEFRFGRCSFFLVFDTTNEDFDIVPNTSINQMHGAGIKAAQMVLDLGVEVVLTGNLGPNAFNVLAQGGIQAFRVNPGNVMQAVNQYQNNELRLIATAGAAHAGLGRTRGVGQGMGRGRGLGGNVGSRSGSKGRRR